MLKIKKNDKVKVLHGKDNGKTGKVLRYVPAKEFLYVEGVYVVKVHTRSKKQGQSGGIISKEGPIHVSNVALICPGCSKPVRVGFEVKDSGEKFRVCKKCGGQL
jgi:large subunit ribosomal protein L24